MIGLVLRDALTKAALAVASTAWGKVLCVQAPGKQFGVFKAQKFTGITTGTKMADPHGDGSVELTDLLISFEKKTSAEVVSNSTMAVILNSSGLVICRMRLSHLV
ncbi:hypothetical protein LCGC14_2163150 [marine sediment metagenome]|uniref:Uncharacterized protein n=1 Tax=marine sediment metagenome TaxID=412755 RepID=A0A0F9DS90_9ZZZZ